VKPGNAIVGVLLCPLIASSLLSPSHAQKISITLLDGRNGHPMKNETIDVWMGKRAEGTPLQVKTDERGKAEFTVAAKDQAFVVAGEWVIDCRPLPPRNSGKSLVDSNVYYIKDVLNAGFFTQNTCGRVTRNAEPGEFIFFVRPAHWWEKMRE